MATSVRMLAADESGGHIVDEEDASRLERQPPSRLEHCQGASHVGEAGDLDDRRAEQIASRPVHRDDRLGDVVSLDLVGVADDPRRIADDNGTRGDVPRHHGARAHARPGADRRPCEDDRSGTDRSACLEGRQPGRSQVVTGEAWQGFVEGHVGTHERVTLEPNPARESHPRPDRHAVAHDRTILERDAVPDLAVAADHGTAVDTDESSDGRSLTDLIGLYDCAAVHDDASLSWMTGSSSAHASHDGTVGRSHAAGSLIDAIREPVTDGSSRMETRDVLDCSLVIPVYKNEENIPDLLEALEGVASRVTGLEVVFVVDGSPDRSHELLAQSLPTASYEAQLLRHSRNFGAFAAVRTGLAAAQGRSLAVMAADLQEPPELIVEFFGRLQSGETDLVLGQRTNRDDPVVARVTSALFWRAYRSWVIPDMPAGGVDVFGCTAEVRDAVLELGETNSSLIAQLFWVGFRREFVPYDRRRRERGSSAWSLRRRFRYMADSIFSFSDLPILVLVWAGVVGLAFSMLIGTATLIARLAGAIEEPGFATIVVAVTFLFSLLITTQGIIGMYLWRAFENTKRKPNAIVMSRTSWPALEPSHGMTEEPERFSI